MPERNRIEREEPVVPRYRPADRDIPAVLFDERFMHSRRYGRVHNHSQMVCTPSLAGRAREFPEGVEPRLYEDEIKQVYQQRYESRKHRVDQHYV